MPDSDDFLKLNEAATLLRIHRSTLYRMIRAGEVPCFRVRSDWRFSRQALEKWAADRAKEEE